MKITNENGIVEVFYEDGGDSGRVLVTAKYNESVKTTAQFNVYAHIDSVWPYTLILNANPDEISFDDGQTTSAISLQVSNLLGEPVQDINIDF